MPVEADEPRLRERSRNRRADSADPSDLSHHLAFPARVRYVLNVTDT
jgi:hypothetical protein